ncbi:sulfite exporter TauE/SafE family protein [Caproiciproducens sp.]|uniref:sulfite exporter TauE/SafE family protein n=1 Tax=Caproiciproducens sp. TaxID=1954376 RepID=UPI0028A030D1|nr:sulfite exporter TauE/SafE family protein [Caproiciproducens sp.]
MSFLFFIVSFFASTVGAISGIGGGVIIKPVLDAISGLNVSTISFMSGCTVLAMTTVSVFKSIRSGIQIDRKKSTLLAVGSVVGGVFGKLIFNLAKQFLRHDAMVGMIQAILLIIMTVGVLIYVLCRKRIKTLIIDNVCFILLMGLLLGFLSSFLGIGGGPINLAILAYFFSMDSKTAAANSIYIILFSQISSLLFTVTSGTIPAFQPVSLSVMMLGGVLGGFMGSMASAKMTNKNVDRLFCIVMAMIILINCSNIFQYCKLL